MPKTILRQFTGGISNEIDAQNLRDDQGEEAVDINLKGFALEPGEGVSPLTDAKHYYYRGEWIEDSEAVSFEESGVGVVKTYDIKRPQFEEIINEDANNERNLGPALPPDAIITGTVVSEGTRGESPADGSHLLELPGNKFGSVDTADPITDAPSLVEHKATTTTDENHIYYYNGQPYWVEKSSGDWTVKTRQWSSSSNEFLSGEWSSAVVTHNSGGSFFKEGYFICWDEQYIDVVTLSNSSMLVDTLNTLDINQGGDQGSHLGFTTGTTALEISSAEISGGIVTFTQKLKTADRKAYPAHTPAADYTITKYENSDNERWVMPRKNDSYLLLLRDGHAYEYAGNGLWNGGNRRKLFLPADPLAAPHESEGKYDDGDDAIELTTNAGGTRAVEWVTPKSLDETHGTWSPRGYNYTVDIGLKYIVEYLPKGEWACVRQLGTNKPEIIVVESKGKTIPDPNTNLTEEAAKTRGVSVTRSFSETAVSPVVRARWRAHEDAQYSYYTYQNFRMTVNVDMRFPQIEGSIHWSANPVPEVQMRWRMNVGPKNTHKSGYAYGTHTRSSRYGGGNKFRWASYTSLSAQRMKIDVVEWSNHHGPAHELDKRKRWVRTLNLGTGRDDGSGLAYTSTAKGKRSILFAVSSGRGSRGLTINTISPPNWNVNDRYAYNNEIIRLCSFPPSGDLTVRDYAGQSTIHTVATIAKADKSISFAEATTKTFSEGDYIRVSEGSSSGQSRSSYRRISSNLPYSNREFINISGKTTKQKVFAQAFVAKIKSISTGKLILEAIPGFKDRFMVGVDEKCYPIITTIDNDLKAWWEKSLPIQERQLIRSDLSSNILLGCTHGRNYGHVGEKQLIEVRDTVGDRYLTGAGILDADWGHKINWKNNTIRAVNLISNEPRILYIENKFLKSQDGNSSNRNPRIIRTEKSALTDKAKIHLTSEILTVVDKGGITVYDPLFGILFVKDKPKKPDGLGITGEIIDGFHVKNNYGTFIFVKFVEGNWKMVSTASNDNKPETTLLSYNFTKPIEFDGDFAWGILKTDSGTYDIHTTVPFFESDIDGSWINHSAKVGNTSNARSAWGQVLTTRLNSGDGSSNNKRWISVDWKYDSGNYLNLGDPVIGLAHETNKMIGVTNEFTWYIKDAPATLHDNASGSNQNKGTIIDQPKIAIKFNSGVTRDVVFFKSAETSLPPSGATGYENRVSFINYAIGSQDFYVLSSNYITLAGENPEEQGYRMGQAAKLDSTHLAFDASRVGKSAFLIGAPNMYNPYGPNIDFYYRASFIDKYNHESVPSPLPAAGITPLDSADDCIQVNLSPTFFRWDNADITKIRLYRYGGDSSEFMFLRDIEMPGSQLPLSIEKPIPTVELSCGTQTSTTVTAASTTGIEVGQSVSGDGIQNGTTVVSIIVNTSFVISLAATATATVTLTFGGAFNGTLAIKAAQSPFYNLSTYFDISVLSTLTNSAFDLTAVPVGGGTSDIDGSWRINQISEKDPPTIAYSTTLSADLNETDTTVLLTNAASPSAWPYRGVIKIDKEYISYSDISATNGILTVGTIAHGGDHTDDTYTSVALSGGSGSGAKATVTVSSNDVTAITITTVGSGYTVANSLTIPNSVIGGAANATCAVATISTNDLTGCVRGHYDSKASSHSSAIVNVGGSAPAVTVVEWVLEMEHRNQDTTVLDGAIENLSGSVPSIINVTNTSLFPTTGTIKVGNQLINYTGKTSTTFTGCTHNANGGEEVIHSDGVTVFSYNETYTTAGYTDIQIVVSEFGYRDKARTPVMSLHSMKEDNWPPIPIKYNDEKKEFYAPEVQEDFFRYITAVGSLYFAGVDADLRFSRYGIPEYWPLEAVVTLDSEIKAIKEHAGEGIVFTTNSVYRVRGTDPKAMIAFRVPDAKGIKDGDRHSIAEFNGGLIWKTASDGLCMYSGGRVSYITRDKHKIPDLNLPYSCVADGVYWLFQRPKANREEGDTGNGFRLEITSGDMRLCQTSIQAYYAYFAKALGKAIVVTSDNSLSSESGITHAEDLVVEEIGGVKVSNLSWKSKKIDAGDPAVSKALGSIAIVYESLESQIATTLTDGIRGEVLAVSLLGLEADDLDAGDLSDSALDGASDLYDVFTKYDSVGQEFVADIGGTNWDADQRKTILMPVGFDTTTIDVGDSIWNELFDDNTKVESIDEEYVGNIANAVVASDGTSDLVFTDTGHTLLDGDLIHFEATSLPGNIVADTNYYVNDKAANTFKVETVVNGGNVQYSSVGSGVKYLKKTLYPTIVLDKEPLRSGDGEIVWGNLPQVHIYINNESDPSRSFTLPPVVSEEPQSVDLYLEDLRKFRTISIAVEGNLKINTISLRHFPVQQYQSQTLHHSADIFYKGIVDFRVMLDGDLIYRKELANAGDEFTEERIYLPASSFGSRVHYMNESRSGMIESVTFNGSLAA